MIARLRHSLLGLSLEEASFARRGFRTRDPRRRQHLEAIGETFLLGYNAALRIRDVEVLAVELNAVDCERQGFAYEGAAMALTLLDELTPWGHRRLNTLLAGPGAAHIYMIHVGAGWALARLPWHSGWPPPWLDSLLGWLAVDGYGFHQGYFYWPRTIRDRVPPKLSGYAARAFDQGLGRSVWFVYGADVEQIVQEIAAFEPSRHADLWSGVGLAATYAGGVAQTDLVDLLMAAGVHVPCLAQGAAFAAAARLRAGNVPPHTRLACEVLCGLAAEEAAVTTEIALHNLAPEGDDPAYEVWRRRIRVQFAHKEVAA